MIELNEDGLVFSFPEVHEDATLTVMFEHTLRIPDDGKARVLWVSSCRRSGRGRENRSDVDTGGIEHLNRKIVARDHEWELGAAEDHRVDADFFDGLHHVMLGASWATPTQLVRRSFRNWFQRHYPFMFAKFRCVHSV